MKVRGATRGALSAWLGLIALQVAVSRGGSGRIASAFHIANSFVERALDPTVPAIPDHSHGAPTRPAAGPKTMNSAAPPAPAPAPLPPLTANPGKLSGLTLAPPR